MPNSIALFQKLENTETFTGHCFCRTAGIIFANEGGNMIGFKNLGWKSDTVVQSYVQSSVQNRIKISNIFKSTVNVPVNKDP